MRRLLAITVLGVIVLTATVVMAVGLTRLPDAGAAVGIMVASFAAVGLYWGLGALIVVRANGHVVGWLFAVAAAITASSSACYFLGFVLASSQPPVPLGGWFALVASLLFPLAIILALPAEMERVTSDLAMTTGVPLAPASIGIWIRQRAADR